jgi:cephalosporin-C deacetylase
MALFDLSGDELTTYRSAAEAPADLADFWRDTLAESRSKARPATVTEVETGLSLVDTYDVTFSGFGGDPIRAWYHRPAGSDGSSLPVVVRYQGYGGGRGLSHEVPPWVLAGYACLRVDTRGQGSGFSPGDTPDPTGSDPAHPGYLTRGILDPATYYYRRVFTDAVLAVDAAQQLPGVDPSRAAVAGGSQGGGISLAVAGLRDDLAAVLADVPFLCDFRRASEIATELPYTELTSYLAVHRDLVEQVFGTLAYFDVSVLGTRASAPALVSAALMDLTCPPSTVYAAYNAYAGPKEMRVYPYNDHEGGQAFHEVEQLAWLRTHLGRSTDG